MSQVITEVETPKATVQTTFELFMGLQGAIATYNEKRAAYLDVQQPAWLVFEEAREAVETDLRRQTSTAWETYRKKIRDARKTLVEGLERVFRTQHETIPLGIQNWDPGEDGKLLGDLDQVLRNVVREPVQTAMKEEQDLWTEVGRTGYQAKRELEGEVKPVADQLRPRIQAAAEIYREALTTSYEELVEAHKQLWHFLHRLNKSAAEIAGLELRSTTSIEALPNTLQPSYARWYTQHWPNLY